MHCRLRRCFGRGLSFNVLAFDEGFDNLPSDHARSMATTAAVFNHHGEGNLRVVGGCETDEPGMLQVRSFGAKASIPRRFRIGMTGAGRLQHSLFLLTVF